LRRALEALANVVVKMEPKKMIYLVNLFEIFKVNLTINEIYPAKFSPHLYLEDVHFQIQIVFIGSTYRINQNGFITVI
jgi:hypothetical protein